MSSNRRARILGALAIASSLAMLYSLLPHPLNVGEHTPFANADCMPAADSVVTLGYYEQQEVAGVHVYFNDDVVASDRQRVLAGIRAIQSYLAGNMEARPSPEEKPTCIDIRVTSSSLAGSGNATGTHVVIFTAPEGWPFQEPWHLQLVTAHEYVHAWQYTLSDKTLNGPTWLIEGAAQLLAARSLVASGSLSQADVQREMSRPSGPMVPRLENLEEPEGFNIINSPYNLAYAAVDMLTKHSSVRSLETYWGLLGSGSAWQPAFERAFRISPADFYAQFEGSQVHGISADSLRGALERFEPAGLPIDRLQSR